MASSYTSNYQLNQWEATDQVVRTDFNADNAKLDAGLKAAQDTADAAKQTAEDISGRAFTPENLPFVVGSYVGNGARNRKIELGFTPRAVLLFHYDGATILAGSSSYYLGGLVLPGQNVASNMTGVSQWNDNYTALAIVDGGFQVTFYMNNGTNLMTNTNQDQYRYLALR